MYSIDMLKTDDIILNAAMDKMRPSRLGDLSTRGGEGALSHRHHQPRHRREAQNHIGR